MSEDRLRAGLPRNGLGEQLVFLESTGSTNLVAAQAAREGAPHGLLVVADEQTAGRGRGQRSWSTPRGTALAVSIVLRPPATPSEVAHFTALGALGVCTLLEDLDLAPQIKWPNDVLLAGKKVAGVLAETAWRGEQLEHLVLGVGLNVRHGSYPPGLDFPATCLAEHHQPSPDRAELVQRLAGAVGHWVLRLGSAALHSAWEARLAFRGQPVMVSQGKEVLHGRLEGLTPAGHLRLIDAVGAERCFTSAEAQLRPRQSDPGTS